MVCRCVAHEVVHVVSRLSVRDAATLALRSSIILLLLLLDNLPGLPLALVPSRLRLHLDHE